jgi:hypothetical protein
MRTTQILRELERVLGQLGVRVRRDKGNFRGGWCTLGDEQVLLLNKHHSYEHQVRIMTECLRGLPVDTVFMKPAVREVLEKGWVR